MSLIRREPVMTLSTTLSILVVMVLTYFPGLHLTSVELAASATITVAVTALVAALLVHPAHLAVISGAVSTILVAATAFGLHLTGEQVAAVASAVVAVLGYLLREKVTPVSG